MRPEFITIYPTASEQEFIQHMIDIRMQVVQAVQLTQDEIDKMVKQFTGTDTLIYTGVDWGIAKPSEPECECDVKALLSFGHDKDCEYVEWKKRKSK